MPTPSSSSNRQPRPLFSRVILSFGGASVVVTVVAMVLIYFLNRHQALDEVTRSARTLGDSFSQQMAIRLQLVESVPGMIALDIEDGGLGTFPTMSKYLELVLSRHPGIYSLTIAWAPDRTADHALLGARVRRHEKGVTVVDMTTVPNYPAEPWFVRGIASSGPTWSLPDPNTSVDELLVSCVVPFSREGKVAGVVTAALTAEAVDQQCRGLGMDHGYAFAVGVGGRLLSWPERADVLRRTLQSKDAELAARVESENEGMLEGRDPWRHEPAWIFYRRLPGLGFSYVQVYPIHSSMQDLGFHETMLVLTTIVLNLILVAVVAIIARSITGPMQKILQAANLLSEGHLDAEIPTLDTRDAMKGIPKAFLTLMAQLQEQIARIQESTRREERAKRELQIAGNIQKAFLTRTFPAFPDRTDFDLHAQCNEAYEVGGDFYDFFLLDDGRLAFALGDTSGKGIPAAIFMAVCRTLLRAIAHTASSPATCLEDVNHRLCDENRTAMFVTCIYGILDARTGSVTLCNAGHLAPVVRRADGSLEPLATQRQRALGVRQSSRYADQTLLLAPGDTLLLYTDGVTEAENPKLALYGEKRLLERVRSAQAGTAMALLDSIVEDVRDFADGAAQSDDLTVLALRCVHPFNGAQKTVVLRNRLQDIPQIAETLQILADEAGVRGKPVRDMQLVLEELLSNIVKYAHADAEEHLITVHLAVREREIRARIEDDGRHFDPRVRPGEGGVGPGEPPDDLVAGPVDPGDLAVGGWGLRLVARKVDRIEYRRTEGRNIVTVYKSLPAGGDAPSDPG